MKHSASYRKLLENSKAAMLAAIEVYNKPQIQYRDECAVILLMNAWELILKAVLSKNGKSVFYEKKDNRDDDKPYRTLSWKDALLRGESHFPEKLFLPIRLNLEHIADYRDNAIHFYNASRLGVVLYGLAQSAILNYKELAEVVFGLDLASEINWQIMPIGIKPPIDPISYLTGNSNDGTTDVVRQFAAELTRSLAELEDAGLETGRLLTIFEFKLQSIKRTTDADATISVAAETSGVERPVAIVRKQDPNTTHPLRQKEVLQKLDMAITSYVFQAIVWRHGLKEKPTYCWRSSVGALTTYSHDVIRFIKGLTESDIEAARNDYREHQRAKRRPK